MSPGRAEAHAEDARSALTRRLARSYLRPDIAPSHRACAVHSRESTSVPSRLSSAAPPLSAEPTGLNPPTPVSGEPVNQRLHQTGALAVCGFRRECRLVELHARRRPGRGPAQAPRRPERADGPPALPVIVSAGSAMYVPRGSDHPVIFDCPL